MHIVNLRQVEVWMIESYRARMLQSSYSGNEADTNSDPT